jgi:hypothetical protein
MTIPLAPTVEVSMRSKSMFAAAIALAGLCSSFSLNTPVARAAGAKDKAAKAAAEKKKAAELHADEKAMKKQLQWEDKVMGPDDKRADLERIARAHAMNEKAEREKERQAALEPAPAPAAAPAKGAKKAEVALPSAPEEKSTGPQREISPQLATEAAKAPPPPVKPADDKFIDKLLKEEHPSSKKHASASDRELENLLAGAKSEKPAGRKKGDSVDDLLKSADKGPAMPAPRAASALPEWTKTPDIAPSTPPPAPPVAKAPPKKDDGVIQVVQGAASFTPPTSFAPPPAPATPPVASRGGRKGAAARNATAKADAKPVEWNDPFADGGKKTASAREFTPAASVTRKEPAARPAAAPPPANWSDPFADVQEVRKPRRVAPTPPAPAASAPAAPSKRAPEKAEPAAHPPGWKDPFTKAPAAPARAQVAMRELSKGESSKWEIASHRGQSRASAASDAPTPAGWAILKKRAR